ncbi:MAG: hypothetical protein ACOY4W_12465 [Thermodesulfobacteriota bacterium]
MTVEIKVEEKRSVKTNLGGLIVSVIDIYSHEVQCVVGRVGFPSVERTLKVGWTILFETPDEGLLEVRLMHINYYGSPNSAVFLLSRVTPQRGLAAGFTEQDASNMPFDEKEIMRISVSLGEIGDGVRARSDVSPEQMDFIIRKLDELSDAATRLGRRDWVNLAVGTIANVIVTAALNSDAGKFLFQAMSTSLAWLFREGTKFLP